jgi:hypothetical protein
MQSVLCQAAGIAPAAGDSVVIVGARICTAVSGDDVHVPLKEPLFWECINTLVTVGIWGIVLGAEACVRRRVRRQLEREGAHLVVTAIVGPAALGTPVP